MSINVIKTSQVSPATASHQPLVLPLTFFDLLWLKLHPTEELVFYKLSESSRGYFFSTILPKLEHSLSLVLTHFLPLSGHLKWDPQDPKPHILVSPQDAVCLTVAETDAEFAHISRRGLRHETELRPLVPDLQVSSHPSSLLSIQITLFPNQGFCIGTRVNHVVMDGKIAAKFHKSWSHICKYGTIPKDFPLPTLLDRSVINVPTILEHKIFQLLTYISKDEEETATTIKLYPTKDITDVVRITLELTQEDVEKLKERAKNESTRTNIHLSTFVVTYAYVWTCMVKSRGGPTDRPVRFMYPADCRDRLNPKVPENYFGNCVLPIDIHGYEAKTFLGEDGFVNTVEILSDSVRSLSSRSVESIWNTFEEGEKKITMDTQLLVVTGSNQFGIYESDYGWGRPIHTQITSLYQNCNVSLSKRRDNVGGVEIGVSLKKCEMDVFLSLFNKSFNNVTD